jgi:deferrochelatase/peroxidase EfeB
MKANPLKPATARAQWGEHFDHVQRIVLCAPKQLRVQHLLLKFNGTGSQTRRFLSALSKNVTHRPSDRQPSGPQLSIGLTYRGLEALKLPLRVLLVLQKLAPSFHLGAPVQAATRLGDTGASAPDRWDSAFQLEALHAVISLHHDDDAAVAGLLKRLQGLAEEFCVRIDDTVPRGKNFTRGQPDERWVHFGYRDGLSKVGIRGWSHDPDITPDEQRTLTLVSTHQPGEFLLGHPDDGGANPWALTTQPQAVRSFFCEASFGVLRQMEQDEPAFRGYLKARAKQLVDGSHGKIDETEAMELVQAKLCGRFPDGRRIDPETQKPTGTARDDFDYGADPKGEGCPFGAHIRRMNPRGGEIAHQLRRRPLLRRGAPYGPQWDETEPAGVERGLLGLFFCSSIENQFEHLLGEWADRVPMGNLDGGRAKDPLASHHEDPDAGFVLPGDAAQRGGVTELKGLKPFVRTRGTAYLLYPTSDGLEQLATEDHGHLWIDEVDREAFR